MTDDAGSLGSSIKSVRKRGVKTLNLGTNEAATVSAGGGKLPHRLLTLDILSRLLLGKDAPVDGEV